MLAEPSPTATRLGRPKRTTRRRLSDTRFRHDLRRRNGNACHPTSRIAPWLRHPGAMADHLGESEKSKSTKKKTYQTDCADALYGPRPASCSEMQARDSERQQDSPNDPRACRLVRQAMSHRAVVEPVPRFPVFQISDPATNRNGQHQGEVPQTDYPATHVFFLPFPHESSHRVQPWVAESRSSRKRRFSTFGRPSYLPNTNARCAGKGTSVRPGSASTLSLHYVTKHGVATSRQTNRKIISTGEDPCQTVGPGAAFAARCNMNLGAIHSRSSSAIAGIVSALPARQVCLSL